jgi:hypothetical protein
VVGSCSIAYRVVERRWVNREKAHLWVVEGVCSDISWL